MSSFRRFLIHVLRHIAAILLMGFGASIVATTVVYAIILYTDWLPHLTEKFPENGWGIVVVIGNGLFGLALIGLGKLCFSKKSGNGDLGAS